MKLSMHITVLALAAFFPVAAFAYGRGPSSAASYSGVGSGVPVSGSIAMPGSTTAVYTNPAGLIGASALKLSLQAGSDKPMDNPSYRGLLLAGNGSFGVGAGVDYRMNDGAATDYGYAVYGLAVDISALNFTLGASGYSGIKGTTGSDFNAGFLFRPTSLVTVGGTAFGLNGNQVDSYGVGIGLTLLGGVDLVADAAFDHEFKDGEFKPGLRLSSSFAGLSVSYGTGATAQFAKDISAAAYLRVSANAEFEFEYNHGGDLPKYFASLTFAF